MTQKTTGFWSVLSGPLVYEAVQYILGAKRVQQRILDEHVRPQQGERVLDIGCGTGEILNFLPQVEYFGFDQSADYIARANATFGDRATFVCDDVSNFALHGAPELSFDLVLAVGVLHHLDDPIAVSLFQMARRAIKPQGRLVTADPCYYDQQGRLDRFLTGLDRGLNVRDIGDYETLGRTVFPSIERTVFVGPLPLPRSACVMVCRNG
jgi:SAM-dependent methyltransferase